MASTRTENNVNISGTQEEDPLKTLNIAALKKYAVKLQSVRDHLAGCEVERKNTKAALKKNIMSATSELANVNVLTLRSTLGKMNRKINQQLSKLSELAPQAAQNFKNFDELLHLRRLVAKQNYMEFDSLIKLKNEANTIIEEVLKMEDLLEKIDEQKFVKYKVSRAFDAIKFTVENFQLVLYGDSNFNYVRKPFEIKYKFFCERSPFENYERQNSIQKITSTWESSQTQAKQSNFEQTEANVHKTLKDSKMNTTTSNTVSDSASSITERTNNSLIEGPPAKVQIQKHSHCIVSTKVNQVSSSLSKPMVSESTKNTQCKIERTTDTKRNMQCAKRTEHSKHRSESDAKSEIVPTVTIPLFVSPRPNSHKAASSSETMKTIQINNSPCRIKRPVPLHSNSHKPENLSSTKSCENRGTPAVFEVGAVSQANKQCDRGPSSCVQHKNEKVDSAPSLPVSRLVSFYSSIQPEPIQTVRPSRIHTTYTEHCRESKKIQNLRNKDKDNGTHLQPYWWRNENKSKNFEFVNVPPPSAYHENGYKNMQKGECFKRGTEIHHSQKDRAYSEREILSQIKSKRHEKDKMTFLEPFWWRKKDETNSETSNQTSNIYQIISCKSEPKSKFNESSCDENDELSYVTTVSNSEFENFQSILNFSSIDDGTSKYVKPNEMDQDPVQVGSKITIQNKSEKCFSDDNVKARIYPVEDTSNKILTREENSDTENLSGPNESVIHIRPVLLRSENMRVNHNTSQSNKVSERSRVYVHPSGWETDASSVQTGDKTKTHKDVHFDSLKGTQVPKNSRKDHVIPLQNQHGILLNDSAELSDCDTDNVNRIEALQHSHTTNNPTSTIMRRSVSISSVDSGEGNSWNSSSSNFLYKSLKLQSYCSASQF